MRIGGLKKVEAEFRDDFQGDEVKVQRANAIEDVGHVIDTAVYSVSRAMVDGAEAGYSDEWKRQSSDEHLGHAWQHVIEASRVSLQKGDEEVFEEHLQHALCRLAMAIFQREEEHASDV